MDSRTADDRHLRLERALLGRGRHSVGFDAAGEPDLAALRAELSRIDFEFIACDQNGFLFEAEFRRAARHQGERAAHAIGTAYSEHNAIIEAAIVALGMTHRGRGPDDRSGGPLSPAPIERLRRARPWGRPTRVPPTIG